jgi:hypothetical protein
MIARQVIGRMTGEPSRRTQCHANAVGEEEQSIAARMW